MERSPSKKGRQFWGENHWDVLHSGAAFYTPDHAADYMLLIQGYKSNLPCKQCRTHFAQNLEKYPIEPYLSDANALLFWTYIVHDAVNQAHNSHRPEEQPKISPPFPAVVKKYMTSKPEQWDKAWCFVLACDAVLYTQDLAHGYSGLVKSYLGLLPSKTSRVRFSQVLEKCPLSPYLRNNHDLFFWTYVASNEFLKGTPIPYVDVKRYYFSGLGEECKTCDG